MDYAMAQFVMLGFLLVVILILIAMLDRERRAFRKREERYINRIMAKDLSEFTQMTTALEKTHSELVEEMTKENELYANMEKEEGRRKGFRLIG